MKFVRQKSWPLLGLLALVSLLALAQLPTVQAMAGTTGEAQAGMTHAGMTHADMTGPAAAAMAGHEHSSNCCQDLMPESCALQGMGHCAAGGAALLAVAQYWPERSGPGPIAPYRGFERVAPPLASDPPPPRI